MFIIVEGGDGTGKSTLCDAIAERIEELFPGEQIDRIHRGPPERDPLEEYAFDVDDYRPGQGRHVVADRWHGGMLVYPQLYRGTGEYGELGRGGFRWVELFLKARGAVLFLADHPAESVRERLRVRGEDYLKDEHLEFVLDRFRDVARMSTLHRATFDTGEHPVDRVVEWAMVQGRFAQSDTKRFIDFPGYVGGATPHTLLVGERHGGKPPHRSESAFIPTSKNSGAFLMDSLPDPFWRNVGLVNAYEMDVAALLAVLDFRPKVVALGKLAHEELTRQGVQHATVPHPQKIRRFHNKEGTAYGEMIATASLRGEGEYKWPK